MNPVFSQQIVEQLSSLIEDDGSIVLLGHADGEYFTEYYEMKGDIQIIGPPTETLADAINILFKLKGSSGD